MDTTRADRRKYYYIYKITRFDGKFYVGMHSTDDLEDGYFGSGKRIRRSLNKHGIDKHQKQILEFCPSRAALKIREAEIVTEAMLDDPMCLNLKSGGIGGFSDQAYQKAWIAAHSPEVEAKRSATRLARGTDLGANNNSFGTCWLTHPTRGNLRVQKSETAKYLEDGWKFGRKMPDGFGKHVSEKFKGKKLKDVLSEEGLVRAMVGRTKTRNRAPTK